MPHRSWKHYCQKVDGEVISGSQKCEFCGTLGQYDGWRLGRIEMMGRYQRLTGLTAMGEHRFLSDLILSPLLRPCPVCGGRGVTSDEEDDWHLCEECDGCMRICQVSEDEFQAARRRILREFPDAAASESANP